MKLSASFIEIHNDNFYDLLREKSDTQSIQIQENFQNEFFLKGLILYKKNN